MWPPTSPVMKDVSWKNNIGSAALQVPPYSPWESKSSSQECPLHFGGMAARGQGDSGTTTTRGLEDTWRYETEKGEPLEWLTGKNMDPYDHPGGWSADLPRGSPMEDVCGHPNGGRLSGVVPPMQLPAPPGTPMYTPQIGNWEMDSSRVLKRECKSGSGRGVSQFSMLRRGKRRSQRQRRSQRIKASRSRRNGAADELEGEGYGSSSCNSSCCSSPKSMSSSIADEFTDPIFPDLSAISTSTTSGSFSCGTPDEVPNILTEMGSPNKSNTKGGEKDDECSTLCPSLMVKDAPLSSGTGEEGLAREGRRQACGVKAMEKQSHLKPGEQMKVGQGEKRGKPPSKLKGQKTFAGSSQWKGGIVIGSQARVPSKRGGYKAKTNTASGEASGDKKVRPERILNSRTQSICHRCKSTVRISTTSRRKAMGRASKSGAITRKERQERQKDVNGQLPAFGCWDCADSSGITKKSHNNSGNNGSNNKNMPTFTKQFSACRQKKRSRPTSGEVEDLKDLLAELEAVDLEKEPGELKPQAKAKSPDKIKSRARIIHSIVVGFFKQVPAFMH